MTDAETVETCPGCGETHFRSVVAADERFHCWKCGERFDEPDVREANHTTGPRRGLAKDLDDVDSLEELAELGGGPA